MTGCSVESLDSTDNLLTAEAKFKIQEVEKSMHLLESEICFSEAPVFVFDFPQNQNGPHSASTDIKLQIETYPGSDEWEAFEDLTYSGSGPEEYTYEDEVLEIGTYSFRAKIGAGGFEYLATLNIVDCSDCEESFSYVDNEDGTYTFTYVPEEDMVDANLVFTFAQGVAVDGLEGWTSNGVTKQMKMDLEACETYSWTVGLDTDCRGVGQPNANLWTDFKVNDVSKKGDLGNIVESCD